MEHEWKQGDRFEGVVESVDEDGDIVLGPDGNHSFQRYIHPDTVTPIPDHSEWVGGPASKLPEGSVVDIEHGVAHRVVIVGGKIYNVDENDQPVQEPWLLDIYRVIRIHKLGEVRPKTLGDCGHGEIKQARHKDADPEDSEECGYIEMLQRDGKAYARDNGHGLFIVYMGQACNFVVKPRRVIYGKDRDGR